MRAIVYSEYGPPDVLRLEEVDKPEPKDNEVLVRVHAVSINDWDWALLRGVPFAFRLLSGFPRPRRTILGSDVAGRIEAVGKNVKRFRPGDEVYGDLSGEWGGFAEYVCARENALAPKPAGMTFEQAAAIPQAGMLATQGLRDKATLRAGQKVLVNGAGGGVGTFAVQIARLSGVEVTGVDRSEKLELMRSVGFDHVIDYAREDFTRNGRCYDLILDVKTNRSPFDYARALCPGGTYVTVGGSTLRLLQAVVLAPWIKATAGKNIAIVVLKQNRDLAYLNGLFEAGKLNPVIDGSCELAELPEAMRHFEDGHHKGKVVITVRHDEKSLKTS